MFRKELTLITFVCAIFASTLQAEQVHSTWVGPADGAWDVASNWNPSIIPDNSDSTTFNVTINGGISGALVSLSQNRKIDALTTYGSVHLTTYDNLPVALRINSNLENTEATSLNFFAGQHIGGSLYNRTGATILVKNQVVVKGRVDNAGDMWIMPITWLGVRHEFHNAGQINISGGTCGSDYEIIDNIGVIKGFGNIYAGYTGQGIQNMGSIYAFGGSLGIGGSLLNNNGVLGNKPLASLYIKPMLDVNNFGAIEVNAGGGVFFDCNLVNEPNAVIELFGGTLAAKTITQKADATLEGFGGITGNVLIDPNAIIKLTGPTNIVGDITISPEAMLEVSDGTTLVTGRTICNGTIHIKGGLLIPQGGLSGDCNIIWEPSAYTNIVDFNLDGAVNFKDMELFADAWLWQTDWR